MPSSHPGFTLGQRDEVFALFEGSGQVEVLNRLMEHSTAHWQRAVLFLVKGETFQPWAARGFEGGVGDAAAKQIFLSRKGVVS